MITIIDYGMGNLGSLINMFKYIDVAAKIESSPEAIRSADKLLLPGVGAFDAAMERINNADGLRDVLDEKVLKEQVPTLGICLGMQLLTESSEEGELSGLGWIKAKTKRFPVIERMKVPHMGWNTIHADEKAVLTQGMPEEKRFYFVHSYYVAVDSEENSMFKTHYGIDFDSGIHSDNVYGCQFHPEKSHKFGMKLLSNFAQL